MTAVATMALLIEARKKMEPRPRRARRRHGRTARVPGGVDGPKATQGRVPASTCGRGDDVRLAEVERGHVGAGGNDVMSADDRGVTRDEYMSRSASSLAEGERLGVRPSLACPAHLDRRLGRAAAHCLGLDGPLPPLLADGGSAGRRGPGPGHDPGEEAAYVREVAAAKTAALRMSLKAVEEDGMPFLG